MSDIYVVIPVYNAEKYLEDTVRSVLMQPCAVAGIVLVDDGSTDASGMLCDRMAQADSKLHVIHQKNAGVSAARNAGIEFLLEHADDGYVAFLDSDDLWYPSFLDETLCSHVAQGQHDIYAFGMVSCDDEAKAFSAPTGYQQSIIPGGNEAIWSIQNHFAANLYKISLLRRWNIRFLHGFKYSEDKYFRMQCLFFAETISFEPGLQYIYRENTAGAMGKIAKICPIQYYLPIVDGWLKSDAFINGWQEASGRECNAGRTLACVYLLDMAREHFMQWRPAKEIINAVTGHPHYPELMALKSVGPEDKNYQDKECFVHYPMRFAWKYRLRGLFYYAAKSLLRLSAVCKLNNKRKFPFQQLP